MSEANNVIEHAPQPPLAAGEATTPAALLHVAVQSGAGVDQLERLMEMQIKWEANEARKAYHAAMAAFRADVPALERQSNVSYGATSYAFSSLDYIAGKVNPILAKHGLSFGWDTEQANSAIIVTCRVSHELGHSHTVTLSAPPDDSGKKNKIQEIGSTVSYLQRYTLLSALGLATGNQDDDAQQQVEVITGEQAAAIKQKLQDTNANVNGFLKYMGIENVDAMPANRFNQAMTMLNKKASQQSGDSADG